MMHKMVYHPAHEYCPGLQDVANSGRHERSNVRAHLWLVSLPLYWLSIDLLWFDIPEEMDFWTLSMPDGYQRQLRGAYSATLGLPSQAVFDGEHYNSRDVFGTVKDTV